MPARRPRIPLPARQQYSLNRSLFYAVIVKIGYCSAVAGVFTNFPIKSQRARAGESFPYIAADEYEMAFGKRGERRVFLTAYTQSTGEFVRTLARHWRLLAALAKRDLSDEYVTHGLSMSWTVIHPLAVMLVYLFVFTKVFPSRIAPPPGAATDAVDYLLSGLIPWLTLSQVMGRSAGSVVGNASIVKQMAFPLELLPIKTLAGPLVFGGTSLAFLIVYGLWITDGAILPAYLLGLLPLVLLTLLMLAGISLVLACAQVFMRDLKEFITIFLSIGLFTHPVLYFPDAIPAAVRPIVYLSPFSYLLFCWQDVMFYGGIQRPWAWLITATFAVVLFALGARLFVVSKSHFGDFL
jgi:lipopolysaccharide transport system permease protein